MVHELDNGVFILSTNAQREPYYAEYRVSHHNRIDSIFDSDENLYFGFGDSPVFYEFPKALAAAIDLRKKVIASYGVCVRDIEFIGMHRLFPNLGFDYAESHVSQRWREKALA